MQGKFDRFSEEEREVLKALLNNNKNLLCDSSKEIIKNLYDDLNAISKKDFFKNYDWEIIGWNDKQENIVIPLSQQNIELFLNILNIKLHRLRQ